MDKRPRVAWFSPVPGYGNEGLVSPYFSSLLLPLLKEDFEIELFHDSFTTYEDYPTFHYLSAYSRHQENPFDLFFYQLEDNEKLDFCRLHIGLCPGIVLFHDLFFVNPPPDPILHSSWEDIVKKFYRRNLPWPKHFEDRWKSEPLAFREAGLSLVSIFSNPRDHGEYRRLVTHGLGKEKRSYYLPLPVSLGDYTSGTRRVSYDQEKKIIIFTGSPRVEHRAHKLLEALDAPILRERCALKWLVRDEIERQQAMELASDYNFTGVEFIEGRSPYVWENLVKEADMAVHTLFSVYGHTNPYLGTSLGAGLPCIITDFGASEYMSDKLVFKVRPGDTEAQEIREVLVRLCEREGISVNEGGLEFVRENYGVKVVACELNRVFKSSLSYISLHMKKWCEFENEAKEELLREIRGYWAENDLGCKVNITTQVLGPVFQELGWR